LLKISKEKTTWDIQHGQHGPQGLRPGHDNSLGDNVVWQVDSVSDYKKNGGNRMSFRQSSTSGACLVRWPPRADCRRRPRRDHYFFDAKKGFESFATEVHDMVEREGLKVLYVFDCLTDLLL
jgi:hypothetical protein